MKIVKVDEKKDIRWIQRLANFQKAFAQLTKFIEKGQLSELEEQGLIKAFEYTFELAWTTMKDFLEYRGQTDIYGSRDAIRKAFQLNLIEDGETWMDMLASRNRTSHTYNRETAEEICEAIKKNYFVLFKKLEKKLNRLKAEPDQT
ncbi:nucleotidyltransferase substrate binding protein [Desulfosarcina ovata]|uniref:Nucleotidyltransferase n=2 Tax=Desulfosarcina ovata TaxID=83564 RepID=A0A5K8A575_9BACT|nr:nucleotidyltransferase substrate binding protein [Desulfosarcina ovata]BBO80289.1 nucleotidyltransferase [Desulfosarcina ovata subsp. sediminis]BBO87679.1 nucleotidyltransferase [Desulfosarcina ovata subsp. ovata]